MYVDCAVHNVRRRYAESGGDAEGRRKARSEIPAKKTYDISGKEAIQASLFSLALTVYLETVHQPNRSSDKPHCHIYKRPTNYPQPVLLLLYGDSAFALLIF